MSNTEDLTIHITDYDRPEFVGQLIDIFEDFLEEKGIKLPVDEDDMYDEEENRAIIYGSNYDKLQADIEDRLRAWAYEEDKEEEGGRTKMTAQEAYEENKKTLFFKVVGKDDFENAHGEQTMYKKVEDLYLIPYFLDKETFAALDVTKAMFEELNITMDELWTDIKLSAEHLMPRRIDTMQNILGPAMPLPPQDKSMPVMTIVTNVKGMFGAAVLFYDGVMEDVSKRLGGDYFVLPSSKHEVICVPAMTQNADLLREMVRDINRTEVDEKDLLSDNVYYYNAEDKTFRIA